MAFKSKLKIVDNLKVTSPCPDENFTTNADRLDKGWFCHHCTKNVYDLQSMSKKEIANLIKKTEGQFCAVISRRPDGSMITKEPVPAATAFLSASVLLASTTLLAPQAMAQSERGDVAMPEPTPPVHQVAGGISIPPPVKTEEPACIEEQESKTKTPPAEVPMEDQSKAEVGRVAVPRVEMGLVAPEPPKATPTPTATPHIRGEVSVEPAITKGKVSVRK